MPRIPGLDPTQRRLPQKLGPANFDTSGMDAGLQGLADVGRMGMQIAGQEMQRLGQEQRQREQDDDALTRAKASNSLADHELQIAAKQADFTGRIARGEVDYNKAGEAWESEVNELEPPKIPEGMNPALAETFNGGVRRNREQARLKVWGIAEDVKRADFRAQLITAGTKNEQVASVSGDTTGAVARNEALRPLFLAAGFDEGQATKEIQASNERIWTNEATGRINAADQSVEELHKIDADLTGENGRYLTTMDPAKRTALSGNVKNRIDALLTSAKHDIDKREAAAEKVIGAMDVQAVSGVPPTPEMLGAWGSATKGSIQEAAFTERVAAMQEVQQVLRLPPGQQTTYLQTKESALLTGGGTVQEKQRLDTLKASIAANAMQMREEPTVWLQNRLQRPVAPIDFAGLQSGDTAQIGAALGDRMDDLTAMRKEYGPQVQLKPLLPQEVGILVSVLETLEPERAGKVFMGLRKGVGDDATYKAVMSQLAPKAPLKALAGDLSIRPGGERVASLLLRGESLLSKKDGSTWKMPADNNFATTFAATVGDAYQGRPEAYQQAYDAARAVYAGSASRDGDTDASITFNESRMQNSIRAVVGNVTEFNGAPVVPPWGMSGDDFEERAQEAIGIATGDFDTDSVNLIATPTEGVYVLARGRTPLIDPTRKSANGQPGALFIDLNKPFSGATGQDRGPVERRMPRR